MSPSEPRKHHVGISQFYLACFVDPDKKAQGLLQVYDYETGKRYKAPPNKACRETDFYRVEEVGIDPNLLEKIRAGHEYLVARYVVQVGSGQVTDPRQQVGETLSYAALVAASDRRSLQQRAIAIRNSIGRRLRDGQVTAEQWEGLREAEIQNGASADQWPPYEDALQGVRNRSWFPAEARVPALASIPHAQDALLKLLQGRHWELHVTDSTANGGFICSDSPLVWGDLGEAVQGRQQSLADHDIEITFPVSRNAALVSYPSARDSTLTTMDDTVAHINARTLQFTSRLLFHAHDDFQLRTRNGRIIMGSEYFQHVADSRARGIPD